MKLLYNPMSISVQMLNNLDVISTSSPVPVDPTTDPTTDPTSPTVSPDHDNGYIDIEDFL